MNNFRPVRQTNLYEVNELGVVRNKETKHIIKPVVNRGRLQIRLLTRHLSDDVYITHNLNRIVFESFYNAPVKYRIHHKDGDTLNCELSNLRAIMTGFLVINLDTNQKTLLRNTTEIENNGFSVGGIYEAFNQNKVYKGHQILKWAVDGEDISNFLKENCN